MISLKLLLEEVKRELDADLEESKTGEEAKRLGLDYMSFGRYGKDGKVTHKSQGGKLVPVKGTGAATKGKSTGKAPAQSAPQGGKAAAPASGVSAGMKKTFMANREKGERGHYENATLLAQTFGTPAEQKQVERAMQDRYAKNYYVGDTLKARKHRANVKAIIDKYSERITGKEAPKAKPDRRSLTPKNVNAKLDTKAVRKTLTTRYQGALRANSVDIIEERPGMVLLGSPGGGGTTDFLAIGQQADGQWAMRAVDYIDKKTGEPKFYDSDNVEVASSFEELMKKSFGVGPSRTPKKPAPRDNYRMSSSDKFRG
jgi:hypothetical protein